jgi:uncharacterized protein
MLNVARSGFLIARPLVVVPLAVSTMLNVARSGFLIAAFLWLAGCGDERNSQTAPTGTATEIPFRVDGTLDIIRDGEPIVTIDLEVAETDSARASGMMQRTAFPSPTSGMLFIFERQEIQSFWMANTPVALDLIFIDADSQIVDISRYARPFSPQSITSSDPARFVLEVPAGFADRIGVSETDRVRWSRSTEEGTE